MNRTVLFVAYLFPPAGGVGIIRAVKFVRYLHELGWRVIVLTVDEPAYAFYDETLFDELPEDLLIYRTPAFQPTARYFASKRQAPAETSEMRAKPSGWRANLNRLIRRIGRTVITNVMLPDEKIGWLPYAVRKGREILDAHDVDVIFSSGAPFTVHSIANRLSRHSGVPWVADFRDPFIGEGSMLERSQWHHWYLARMERTWIEQASRVISVTEPMKMLFVERYPDIDSRKWVVVTNGYDEKMFSEITPLPPSPHFEVHYIGSLYEGMLPSLMPFLKGLRLFFDSNTTAQSLCRLIFTGKLDSYAESQLLRGTEQFGLQDNVKIMPSVTHSQAIQKMMSADVLLVFLKVRIAIHVKIFEYLRAKRPILALVRESAGYDVLSTMDGACIIAPEDSQAIAEQLEVWFRAWQANELPIPKNEGHEQYERRALTVKLAEVFEAVIGEGR